MTNTSTTPITAVRVDVDVRDVAPVGVERIVGDVFFPTSDMLGEARAVVVCLPGGGMSRRYFDLRTPDVGDSYSMARHLASAGLVVVTVDPPGVGESDRPIDGYTLMPRVVADVAALATHEILDRLRKGSIDPNVGPLENLLPVGLGHSAGALLIVVQQARSRCYDALVLLGFSGEGLIDFLTEDERRYVNDPARLRSALTALTKERFGGPLPTRPSSDSSSSLLVHGVPPETAMEAIREATSPLLGLVGLTSMVPGSIREELETIDAPVFLGVGEFDITGRAHRIPEELPTSRDITMFVLPDAGHNHNVADTRELLWGRTARWIQAL